MPLNRTLTVVLGICTTFLGGCNGTVESNYWLQLMPISPFDQNPFDPAPDGTLIVKNSNDNAVIYPLGNLNNENATLEDLPPLNDAYVGLLLTEEATDPQQFRAYGQTGFFELDVGNQEESHNIFVATPNTLGDLGNMNEARLGAAATITASGDLFVFGGVSDPQDTVGSADILKMSPLDNGEWEFEQVGEMTDNEGQPFPLVGAEAIIVDVDDTELIYVVGGSNNMTTLAFTQPAGFLFDPVLEEIVWWPENSAEQPQFYKFEPYTSVLADGTVFSIGTNYEPTGDSSWNIPAGPSAEIFDPQNHTYTTALDKLTNLPFDGFALAEVPLQGHLFCGGTSWIASRKSMLPKSYCGLIDSNLGVTDWGEILIPRGDGTFSGIAFHAMVMLNDSSNRILLTGGIVEEASNTFNAPAVTNAWILDSPGKDAVWREVGNMASPRTLHRLVPTTDGGAIVVGGGDKMGPGLPYDFAPSGCPEYFNPDTEEFELLEPCNNADSGPDPVVATHPAHETIVLGYRTLANGDGPIGVFGLGAPSDVEWSASE